MAHRWKKLVSIQTPEGMEAAALLQAQRRGDVTTHRFVVGGLRACGDGAVKLFAVECGPAYEITRPIVLTATCRRWNRWRTRQAAQQFLQRHELEGVHVFDLGWADVLRVDADPRCCESNGSI